MKIIDRIERIKEEYADDYIVRKNGTLLLEPGKIPNCRHMIFTPLEQEYIDEYLIAEYELPFPPEYIKFLRYANGANLLNVKVIASEGFEFAYGLLKIFGLPRLPTSVRAQEMEEPYDVRIEDLARHPELSKSWLKCGTYVRDNDLDKDADIFIDTKDGKVYSCYRKKNKVIDQWDSLDECLCDLFDTLSKAPREYID